AHICLAAQELGLGSCILGWFDEKKVIAACQLDDNKKVSLVIALGYAANQQRRDKKRKKLESIAKYI
ncbi:MAG TPA: nitroreductase, partial [Clostridiales bacterium]|nr:nitroreductase [Clostridiales bacterium]